MVVIPVILCGGVGSRLWPLSRRAYPKQLLALYDGQSLLQATISRTRSLPTVKESIVVCNKTYRFLVADQLQQCGLEDSKIVIEPVGRNTAPAVALAAMQAMRQHKDAILLVLPADHIIKDIAHFARCVEIAVQCAAQDKLVTFGIAPTRAETGYGYIKVGEQLAGINAYHANHFVEKPDPDKAQSYLEAGGYYWNSGMYVFKAINYLAELKQHAPEIYRFVQSAFTSAIRANQFIELELKTFSRCPNDSIDYAVMEKTDKCVVVPMDSKWSDIGSWAAMMDMRDKDSDGNVKRGDVLVEDTKNSYLRSDGRLIAAVGVDDLVVVETSDAVLVAKKDKSQDVKKIVERLRADNRPEADFHRMVYRPWGSYEGLDNGSRFQVKHLSIKPGATLSLQMHHHRSEHWVVVQGTAEIIRGDEVFQLFENQSTYIPQLTKHRIRNIGKIPLEIIEVQVGNYLGEDDIVRYEDVYGRAKELEEVKS